MNKSRYILIAALTPLLLTMGCVKPKPSPIEAEGMTPLFREPASSHQELPRRAEGTIAPGNEFSLSTLVDSKINGKYRVDFDGKLHLPYGVMIDTDGKTISELRSAVNESFQKFFKSSPEISVTLTEKKYYLDVQGLVNKPGKYLVREESSLDEVMSAASGLKTAADNSTTAKYVRVKREGATSLISLADYYSGSDAAVPRWQGGETVFFQQEGGAQSIMSQANAVQLLGQVQHPGEYQYVSGATFYYYLAKAGGPNDRADLDQIELVRFEAERQRSEKFSLEEKGQVPQLEPGDMVIVHADKQNQTVSNISGVMQSIASAFFVIFGF